ncbi:MAG: hypothetical protein DHS80DRAFT_28571 [Piptocephalis tieghemiana]|nr:MAG: hypothetical protein DHS80DRAFT_28571 [Piptocephalis tieghemiana]
MATSSRRKDPPTRLDPPNPFLASAGISSHSLSPFPHSLPDNAKDLVLGQVASLTHLLRGHPRWANHGAVSEDQLGLGALGQKMGLRVTVKAQSNSNSGLQDTSLLQGFISLRHTILTHGMAGLDRITLLSPFLEAIRSGDAPGDVTAAALDSVCCFLASSLFEDVGVKIRGDPEVARDIARAATRCRFEASSHPLADEAVLLGILALADQLLSSPLGSLMDDTTVCEVMETTLSMCCQARLSPVLRKAASTSACHMLSTIFGRLAHLLDLEASSQSSDHNLSKDHHSSLPPPTPITPIIGSKDPSHLGLPGTSSITSLSTSEEEGNSTSTPLEDQDVSHPGEDLTTSPLLVERPKDHPDDSSTSSSPSHSRSHSLSDSHPPSKHNRNSSTASASSIRAGLNADEAPGPPYGLPAIREILRVLVSLADPHDPQYGREVKEVALKALKEVIRVAGPTIHSLPQDHPLISLITDHLFHHLFQLGMDAVKDLLLAEKALTLSILILSELPSPTRFQRECLILLLLKRLEPLVGITPEEEEDGGRSSSSQVNPEGRLNNKIHEASLALSRAFSNPHALSPSGDSSFPSSSSSSPPSSSSTSSPHPTDSKGPMARARQGDGSAHPQVRRLWLETLMSITLEGPKGHLGEIWWNYDAQLGCVDVWERVVSLLCAFAHVHVASAFPETALIALQGLDTLLEILEQESILDMSSSSSSSSLAEDERKKDHDASLEETQNPLLPPTVEALNRLKNRKQLLLQGARKFNVKPKEGMAFVESHGILQPLRPDAPSPEEEATRYHKDVATFCRTTPYLDKTVLGEFLSKKDHFPILRAFVSQFDFQGCRIDEALRLLLESFRLPGESQLIERIMEVFSDIYFATNPPCIATFDATFILSYSVIMLNTDLHSRQVRSRMSLEDYMKNLRGVNGGKNFDTEYLLSIYEAIRDREIVMPSEHTGRLGFDWIWREEMAKGAIYGPIWLGFPRIPPTTTVSSLSSPPEKDGESKVDPHLLSLTASRVRSYVGSMVRQVGFSLAVAWLGVFERGREDNAYARAIRGLEGLVRVAAQWGMVDLVDGVIQAISRATGLLGHGDRLREHTILHLPSSTESFGSPGKDDPVVVSGLAIRFGQSYRGQLALLLLFRLATSVPWSIGRPGWAGVVGVLSSIFCCGLFPPSLLLIEGGESEGLSPSSPAHTSSSSSSSAISVPLRVKSRERRDPNQGRGKGKGRMGSGEGSILYGLASYLYSSYTGGSEGSGGGQEGNGSGSGKSGRREWDDDYEGSSSHQGKVSEARADAEAQAEEEEDRLRRFWLEEWTQVPSPWSDSSPTEGELEYSRRTGVAVRATGLWGRRGETLLLGPWDSKGFSQAPSPYTPDPSGSKDQEMIKEEAWLHSILQLRSGRGILRDGEYDPLRLLGWTLAIRWTIRALHTPTPAPKDSSGDIKEKKEQDLIRMWQPLRAFVLGERSGQGPADRTLHRYMLTGILRVALHALRLHFTDLADHVICTLDEGGDGRFQEWEAGAVREVGVAKALLALIRARVDWVFARPARESILEGLLRAAALSEQVEHRQRHFGDGYDEKQGEEEEEEEGEGGGKGGRRQEVEGDERQPFQGPDGKRGLDTSPAKRDPMTAGHFALEAIYFYLTGATIQEDSYLRSIRLLGFVANLGAQRRGTDRWAQAKVKKGVEAVEALYRLHARIPKLIRARKGTGAQRVDEWVDLWYPLLHMLATQCGEPGRRPVRLAAFTALQKALLRPSSSPSSSSTPSSSSSTATPSSTEERLSGSGDDGRVECVMCFERILFPLLGALASSGSGNEEMQGRVVGLMCSYYLIWLPKLLGWSGLGPLWSRLLAVLVPLGEEGGLREAVLESLKNVILVMSASGAFPGEGARDEGKEGKEDLWRSTWQVVDTIAPGMKEELFPPPVPDDDEEAVPGKSEEGGEQGHEMSVKGNLEVEDEQKEKDKKDHDQADEIGKAGNDKVEASSIKDTEEKKPEGSEGHETA